RNLETLYVMHGTTYNVPDGTVIARVVFRFEDGSSATNGIEYGTHVRDWWQRRDEKSVKATDPSSKVGWRATTPTLPAWAHSLRFFVTALENPKPGIEVKTIDLFSAKEQSADIILGLTVGPA